MIVVVKVRSVGFHPPRGRFMSWCVSSHGSPGWGVVEAFAGESDTAYNGMFTWNIQSDYFEHGRSLRRDDPWNP